MKFELVESRETLLEIDKLVWQEVYGGTSEDFRPRELALWRNGFSVYASYDDIGDIVATGSLKINNDKGVLTSQLEHVAVAKPKRGNGIGTMVVNHLIELADESGCSYVFLHSTEGSLGFYEKLGFIRKDNENVPFLFEKNI